MKILSLSVLAGVVAAPAAACDLCSVYSAMQARGEVNKGFTAGVAEQFTHYGALQKEGHEVPNVLKQHLDSSFSQLFAGFNFTDRFGVQVNLPIIYRSFQRAADSGGIERGTESGVGDVSLVANFLAHRQATKKFTLAWTVHGGIKFPTGSNDRLKEELDELTAPPPPPGAPGSGIHGHALALGSGSEISVTWGERLSAEVGVDLPMSLDNTALQSVPDYRVRAAVNWRF